MNVRHVKNLQNPIHDGDGFGAIKKNEEAIEQWQNITSSKRNVKKHERNRMHAGANNWLVSDEEEDIDAANAFMAKREAFIEKYYKTEKRAVKVISRAERKQMEVKGVKFFRIYSPTSLALGRKTMTEILEK